MQNPKSPILSIIVAALAAASLHAATPVWDTGAGGGIQAGSGTWDFGTTANWTLDGGTSRVGWTSNADTALFQLQGTNGTVTIDNSQGQVGAAGLIFGGSAANSGSWNIEGGALQLGAGGMNVGITNDTNVLNISAPVVLTASQTWSSRIGRASNGVSGVNINGAISSQAGTTNLVFDGGNRYNSSSTGSSPRVSFSLGGANTYTGSTTVTGGAQLVLNFTTGNSSRLDDNGALILEGGSIMMNGNGGSEYTETVGSTTINAGHSSIINGSSGAGGTTNHLSLGAITHNVGGTFDVSNAAADIARTSNTNTNQILGGWATVGGGTRFAAVSGVNNSIGTLTGSTINTYDTWAATNNVVVTAAVNGATNKTINSLRLASGGSVTLATGQTLTIASGGIIGNAGTGISGGNLTSGLASGELFVHTPSALTISSAIVDNGGVGTVLVKAGTNTLTVSGENTYTGGTFINAGTLLVTGDATLQGEVTQAGGSTLAVGNGGTLSPGAAGETGSMTLGGNVSLNDGAIVNMQLGAFSDMIALTNGFATLSGSASAAGILLNISDAGGLTLQTYSLIEWAEGTTLSSFDLSDFNVVTADGITGTLQFGTNSLDFVVTTVPEPSTVILALGGLCALGLLRRRRATLR